MIKPYNGYKAEKTSGPREQLPAGGYVAKIISAKVETYKWGDRLAVAYDVVEGEHAGFFKRDYDANTNEDKKWRGVLRLTVPTDAADRLNDMNRRRFNNFTACLEESNPGYRWDWDETKLRNLVGEEIHPADITEDAPIVAGYIGPYGISDKVTYYVDLSLKGINSLVAGANREGYHYTGLNLERDLDKVEYVDIAKVQEGGICPCPTWGRLAASSVPSTGGT